MSQQPPAEPTPTADVPDDTPAPGPAGAPTAPARASDEAVRAVLRRALRDMLLLVGVLLVLGGGLGLATSGLKGLWGALLGVAVTLVFSGTTVLSMLRTVGTSVTTTGAVILGTWLVKMVVLVAAFVLLDGQDFYQRDLFVGTLLVGVLGSLYLDYLAATRGRVPYTEPV